MKKHIILFIILTNFAFISNAQLKETVLKSVHDDGKTMQLKITVALHDASIYYDNKFDVSGMNKEQKDKLVNHIIDSLGATKYLKSETSNKVKESSAKDLVIAAVRDYVEGVYEADTSKIERSVAKHLSKRGYYTNNGMAAEGTMTYDQLISLTKQWSKNKTFNENTPKKIIVLDMLDKTASAKLEAYWGIDYFHLAKVDGKWMIINVLWQDYPKK